MVSTLAFGVADSAPLSLTTAQHRLPHEQETHRVTEQTDKDLDAILVRRVQRGDRRAYDFLVVKYQHKVAALIRRYARDPQDVADLSQDTFVRAYQALGSFRGDSAFYSWLYRIAVNTALSHVGGNKKSWNESELGYDQPLQDLVDGQQSSHGPEEEQAASELHTIVRAAMAEIPADMAQALRHREWDGMSYEAIAEAMHVPVGTVRSRIFRAREAVEQRIRAWQAGGQEQ
ncbi:sigma-70 family RNA polymerase sigma factor [Salinispirillum marinum]|uniref:Sigma-70 family RNA polymerase sigma factor n=1 Tax=Saccharospirillum mangrovi TaxID=2161747 RepID=A0ABV7ZYY3_9GAMM